MTDLLSRVGSELSERKALASSLAAMTAIGIWLLIAHACRSSQSAPVLGKETFACTSCNQSAEMEIDAAFVRDKPTECPQCGKETAWVQVNCPHCRQVFPYGLLLQQGSDRAAWKCPKCDTRILNPAKTFICTSCDQTAELKTGGTSVRDKPRKCPHCGKNAAWEQVTCPKCQQRFAFGKLQRQGSDRFPSKCPKCGATAISPARGETTR